jgi:rRNA maturation protein Nop10
MTRAFGADSVGLSTLMAYLMGLAASDLNQPDPTRLYRRFVGWTLDDRDRCPACGRRGHAPVPGVPPRLCPCDKLYEAGSTDAESATGNR